jgi:hypothetical protein
MPMYHSLLDPSEEYCKDLWGILGSLAHLLFLDKERFVKKLIRVFLPKNKVHEKIYLPRLFEELTIEKIIK